MATGTTPIGAVRIAHRDIHYAPAIKAGNWVWDGVVPGTADQRVRTAQPSDRIVARRAHERIVRAVALENIVERDVPRKTVEIDGRDFSTDRGVEHESVTGFFGNVT